MGVFSHLFAWGQKRAREGKTAKQEARLQSRVQAERLAAESARKRRLDLPQPGKLERGVHSTGEFGSTGTSITDLSEVGEPLDLSDVSEFLAGRLALMVDSSNLEYAKFYPALEHLEVGFKNGSAYRVSPVTLAEASSFAAAPSKGTWYWNNVRVRGSRTAHRKTVWQIH